ncbi:MAG: hypothetical protein ACRDS9_24670 [Pseudonocardiaceae bacterium]
MEVIDVGHAHVRKRDTVSESVSGCKTSGLSSVGPPRSSNSHPQLLDLAVFLPERTQTTLSRRVRRGDTRNAPMCVSFMLRDRRLERARVAADARGSAEGLPCERFVSHGLWAGATGSKANPSLFAGQFHDLGQQHRSASSSSTES